MHQLQLASYPIYVGDIAHTLPPILADPKHSAIMVLSDTNTHTHCLPLLSELLQPYTPNVCYHTIPAGEQHKNINTCAQIWSAMLEHRLDRKAIVLNVGGGVLGDMGGFAAATYKRGIGFVQIPTTLLAQTDASIGSKLGIDFDGIKNAVGCFTHPNAVLIDPCFLATLPQRQLQNGFAEMLKHALIADVQYWEQLKTIPRQNDPVSWTKYLLPSLHIKQTIVQSDPYEKGRRKILNFGHTIGHAIESWSLATHTNPLLHGEAIIIGMIAELYLSHKLLGLPFSDMHAAAKRLQHNYPNLTIDPANYPQLLQLMQNDKKSQYHQIQMALLREIGQAEYDIAVSPADIKDALYFYQNLTLEYS